MIRTSEICFAVSSFLFSTLGLITKLYVMIMGNDVYVAGTTSATPTFNFLLNLGAPVSFISVCLFFAGVVFVVRDRPRHSFRL